MQFNYIKMCGRFALLSKSVSLGVLLASIFFAAVACDSSDGSDADTADTDPGGSDSEREGDDGDNPTGADDWWTGVTDVVGTAYYVSSSGGDDANSGTSPETAWLTLDRVNSQTLAPGDGVLFKRGDLWRGQLVVGSSGTESAYVMYGAYGEGPRPRIYGSPTTGWTEHGENVWRSTAELFDPYDWSTGGISGSFAAEIWFQQEDGTVVWGHPRQDSIDSLTQEYHWTWSEQHIYIYSPTDPAERYASVEVPQHRSVVDLGQQQNVAIDGLGLFYALIDIVGQVYRGAYSNDTLQNLDLHGYVLRNSELAYVGTKNGVGYGTNIMNSDSLIENNEIHDCGRRSICLYNYALVDVSNILVQHNTMYNGFHTTGVDLSAGSEEAPTGDVFNVIIRNNLTYHSPNKDPEEHGSELTFVAAQPANGNVRDIHFLGNVYMYPDGSSLHLESIEEAFIIGNTFYGYNEGRSNGKRHIALDACEDVTIYNNIFYGTPVDDGAGDGMAVNLSGEMDFDNVTADYNLYYQEDPSAMIVQRYVPGQYEVGEYQFFTDDWETLQTRWGWETNSPAPSDPLFIDAAVLDFHLQPGSPAMGAGTVAGATTDWDDVPYSDPPSLGAYAFVE